VALRKTKIKSLFPQETLAIWKLARVICSAGFLFECFTVYVIVVLLAAQVFYLSVFTVYVLVVWC
jgi:hypothetical protein